MGKVNYEGIEFDSELEINYYKHLKENNINFKYQNEYSKKPIKIELGRRKTYTPDFIVYDDSAKVITIVETKGYAKWSANEDDNIMDFMKNQVKNNPDFIIAWLKEIKAYKDDYSVSYQRIRFNQTYGWVDYKFKSPNTIANKRKAKIDEQKNEIKELREFKKNAERFFTYHLKLTNQEKLTKQQREWYCNYVRELNKNYYSGECKKGE